MSDEEENPVSEDENPVTADEGKSEADPKSAAEESGEEGAEGEEEESGEEGEESDDETESDSDEDDKDEEFTDNDEDVEGQISQARALEEEEPEERICPLEAIGSAFAGEWLHGRMHGFGRYQFSNGNYYVGHFVDGQLEGEGTLYFPDKGKYVGVWKEGRAESGDFVFADNLLYEQEDWGYCQPHSRMFWSEIEHGLKPAGSEQVQNKQPPPKIPIGCYDVGDGWYYPETEKIYKYDNNFLRTPDAEEKAWILEKCRQIQ